MKEIEKFVSDSKDKERLLSSLVDSFMNGMKMMGEYQRQNIEVETANSIKDIETKITASIEEVLDEVVELREKVIALPSN